MTITEIYTRTAASYGRQFIDDTARAWNRTLQGFTPAEIQNGVDQWQRNVVEDFDHRPLGSKMPQPADVLALCSHNRELAQRKSGVFTACDRCEEGWQRLTMNGNVAVRMCECRIDFLCAHFSCTRAELPDRLKRHRQDRAKRKHD